MMPDTTPRVSIITIFLNAERFLDEAIQSALGQSLTDFELILVDDGSTDGSTLIARKYANRDCGRVRYLEHPGHVNRGMSASRNLGLQHARGELITFIDADDVWRRAKLLEQAAILDAHPELMMVCGAARYWRSWAGGQDEIVRGGHKFNQIISAHLRLQFPCIH